MERTTSTNGAWSAAERYFLRKDMVGWLVVFNVPSAARSFRPGVCRPCVETKLTATKKSATDLSQLYVDGSVLTTAYN